jgi:Flp pilus assembly pilin Flp
MEKLHDFFRSLAARGLTVRAESGQALIEYALIISLIALVAITALQTTGTNVAGILNTIAGEV